MTPKEQALLDIKEDLKKEKKSFIPFKKSLSPIMRKLVRQQLKTQNSLKHWVKPSKANSQLVAHCSFLAKNNVKFDNYGGYYDK